MNSAERLLTRLRSEGEKTIAFFRALTPAQLEQTLYTDGAVWRVHDVLAHITQSEDGFRRLIEGIVQGGNTGAPEDFDLDAYNQRKVQEMRALSRDELLREFRQRRERTIRLVASLGEHDLQKTGRHPFLGWSTVEEMLKLLYRHIQIHQRDIRKRLKTDA